MTKFLICGAGSIGEDRLKAALDQFPWHTMSNNTTIPLGLSRRARTPNSIFAVMC